MERSNKEICEIGCKGTQFKFRNLLGVKNEKWNSINSIKVYKLANTDS